VFPELRKLERKYPKELVVIGIHSAKFDNEKDTECIRDAVVRHDLEHPVANDADFKIFRAYGAQGWPHFSVVDPEGKLVWETSGEGNYENFVKVLDFLIKKFEGKLNRTPVTFTLERSKMAKGALFYPGKIVATPERLYISDTRHHRIVVADPAGKVQDVIGGHEEGRKDGDFASARFNQPQGLLLRGDRLYVADTENHIIREVDLKGRTVRTIAGTGEQVYNPRGNGEALKTALNSPWDFALDGDRLFIAMAGNHQIWMMDLKSGRIGAYSGSGRERLTDGTHANAAFNQPSGLSIAGGKLYVADSEVSGVREVDLDPKGGAKTVVGTGLFDFGDVDGTGDAVRMQHVLAVHAHEGKLFVADAYNHKIKVCDPSKREVKSFLGTGRRGRADGKTPQFYEPGGLSVSGDKLYIADTNNHAIRVCDLKTGEVATVPVEKK
jgi:DNA-binding beta-propeller fold protein YncE